MNKMATNQVQTFCVLEEPDDTKTGKPLHLIELTLSNFNGKTINSRMDISCAMLLSREILSTAQGIMERYPLSADQVKKL